MAKFVSERTWLINHAKSAKYIAATTLWWEWVIMTALLAVFVLAGWKIVELVAAALRY